MPTAAPTAHRRKSTPVHGLKSVLGEGPGVFEGVVAVFGNVDYMNDRIIPGAFAASLDAWAKSGDPIPVIFSHQWDELGAHLGTVLEAKELLPGDSLLPPEIRSNGGLWAKMRLDVESPHSFAPRVAELLGRRSLREFSFAYDVTDQEVVGGVNELRGLDIIEIGPTLKGANPLTALLSRAKSLADLEPAVVDELRALVDERVTAALAAAQSATSGEGAGNVDDDRDDQNGNPKDPDPANPPEGEEPGDGKGEDPNGSDHGTGETERLALELEILELELSAPS